MAEGFFILSFFLVISYDSVWLDLELFGLVQAQVHTLSAVHARAHRECDNQRYHNKNPRWEIGQGCE